MQKELGAMSSASLRVNDLIQIRILNGEVREAYPSRVEDLKSDEVFIAWPTEGGQLIPVVPRVRLSVSFLQEGKYFTFEATVRRIMQVPVPAIVLKLDSGPRQIERRNDVRVRVAVALELSEKVVSLASFKSQGDHASIHTFTEDLSGGGFCIRHGSYVPPGSLYDVQMTLPDKKETLSLAAKVVRCTPGGQTDRNDFEVAFSYVQIPEKVRSRIVRFVFACQISEMHTSD